MSVTATRLGAAPLTLDWTSLGNLSAEPTEFQRAWSTLKARFDSQEVGFYKSTSEGSISQLGESQRLAQEILSGGRVKDCLFLGIGGSSLGPLSLLQALEERRSNSIRFHFMENPDPIEWKTTLSGLDPQSTLVCAVTKSGTTFETMAQLLCALEWLGKERWKTHLVAITDPEKGDLKQFAQYHEIRTLHIAPSVGGRFSIFTPVGLFAAALAGLNTQEFMQGAQQIRDYCDKTPLEKNPLFLMGSEFIRQFKRRPIHVCMPYSSRLKSIGSWFVQLWGESLGKDGKGFTPLAALGATDQHSILQLLRDGPDDKVTFFITVDQVADPVRIPRLQRAPGASGFQAFTQLEGHTLHDLLRIEYQATSLVLTKRNRPHLTWRLDRLDERALGSLYFSLSVLTAVTGTLWEVNPFDQPGVEEGKVYIREALRQDHPRALTSEEDENSPVNRLRRHHETQ